MRLPLNIGGSFGPVALPMNGGTFGPLALPWAGGRFGPNRTVVDVLIPISARSWSAL
jgi:hypothetical protein